MYVYERMTKRPTSVSPDYSISKAYQIMNEYKYSQLPVTDSDNKLVGLLTEKMMAEYMPSKATSLSVYEVSYILLKTKVADVMAKDIFTISKDAFIEDAAVIMKENRINSLPVLDGNYLVGILTKTDIFSAFIELMGSNAPGMRITINAKDKPGIIADIAGVLAAYDINIRNLTNIIEAGNIKITIKLKAKSDYDANAAVDELKNKGYNIENVTVFK